MFYLNRIGWLTIIVCLWVTGCSSLHVETDSAFDWSRIKTVSVVPPETDSWNLLPVIYEELAAIPVDVSNQSEQVDLVVQYSVQEGPDLDSQGTLLNRPKSLHVQFFDPSSEKMLAIADYFYADTDIEPAAGIRAAFAGLREKLAYAREKKASPTESRNTEQPSPDPEQQLTQSEKSPAEVPAREETASEPLVEKSVPEKIAPQTRSPWLPRLKTWGFENWGEQTNGTD